MLLESKYTVYVHIHTYIDKCVCMYLYIYIKTTQWSTANTIWKGVEDREGKMEIKWKGLICLEYTIFIYLELSQRHHLILLMYANSKIK
jgi:hypothetical protein